MKPSIYPDIPLRANSERRDMEYLITVRCNNTKNCNCFCVLDRKNACHIVCRKIFWSAWILRFFKKKNLAVLLILLYWEVYHERMQQVVFYKRYREPCMWKWCSKRKRSKWPGICQFQDVFNLYEILWIQQKTADAVFGRPLNWPLEPFHWRNKAMEPFDFLCIK